MLDNPLIRKPLHCHLWNILLLLAQHEKKEFIFADEKWTLETGQFLTGRKKLSELSGVSESQTERILKYLENEHQITQLKTNKFRIITIVNWDKYQNDEAVIQQANNRRTTEGQQKDTYKNDKNVKNDKKKNIADLFDIFWTKFKGRWNVDKGRYNKGSKHDAQIVWKTLTVAERQLAVSAAPKSGGKFTQDACRWLKSKRWEDDEASKPEPPKVEQVESVVEATAEQKAELRKKFDAVVKKQASGKD